MLKLEDVLEILAIPLLGVIPESPCGAPRLQYRHASDAWMRESPAGRAYNDAVGRFLGETIEHRFLKPGAAQPVSAAHREGRLMLGHLRFFRRDPKRQSGQGASADPGGA